MSEHDHRMEMALGMGLRVGVIVASAVTAAGGVWLMLRPQPEQSLTKFFPEPGRAVLGDLLHHGPRTPETLILLGLLLLVATPVLRVAAMVVGFLLERDRMYAIVSAVVLGVLVLGFFF